MIRRPPRSPLFPSPTLFRSRLRQHAHRLHRRDLGEGAPRPLVQRSEIRLARTRRRCSSRRRAAHEGEDMKKRSEEHTSELQSQSNLVCRLLLEKKKKKKETS